MRRCRYYKYRKPFFPEKHFYFYCSWECRVTDVGPNYEGDYRGHQRERDTHYDRGYWDGAQSKPSTDPDIPKGIWKGMMLLCHPDKYEQEPGLKTLASEVTRWLLEHRPSGQG